MDIDSSINTKINNYVFSEHGKVLYIASEPAPGMVPFAASIINSAKVAGCDVWAITVSSVLSYKSVIDSDIHHIDISFPAHLWGKFLFHFYPIQLYHLIRNVANINEIKDIRFLTGEYGLGIRFTSVIDKKYNLTYVVHDLEQHPVNNNRNLLERVFDRFFHRMTLRNIRLSSCLATCSRSQYQLLCDTPSYRNKQIVLFPFPSLVTESIKKGDATCPEVEGLGKYILFFGRVCYYKGIHLIYDAFLDSKLSERYKLVIAGKGSRYFDSRSDEHNVLFINRFIPDNELRSLFSNAHFVVYPYLQVTMSGVLQLAHYFEKRAVIPNLQFFLDNMKETDKVFKCGSIDSLRENIEEMAYELSKIND